VEIPVVQVGLNHWHVVDFSVCYLCETHLQNWTDCLGFSRGDNFYLRLLTAWMVYHDVQPVLLSIFGCNEWKHLHMQKDIL
jgi:hypothetical protein